MGAIIYLLVKYLSVLIPDTVISTAIIQIDGSGRYLFISDSSNRVTPYLVLIYTFNAGPYRVTLTLIRVY